MKLTVQNESLKLLPFDPYVCLPIDELWIIYSILGKAMLVIESSEIYYGVLRTYLVRT